jgi:hypothetical protein
MIGAALLATGALSTTAIAQTSPLTGSGSIKQSKKGTKKKPATIGANVAFTLPAEQKATLNTITYTFPKNVKISGKGFKKGTKVGEGTATALARTTPVDFTFDITVLSANKINLALESQTPGIAVESDFPGTIKGQKLTVKIPTNVQQPIGGLYSYVTGIDAKLSAKSVTTKKGKKETKTSFVSSTSGCKTTNVGISLALSPNDAPAQPSPIEGTAALKC